MQPSQSESGLSKELPKRPDLLKVLCILSFIGSGLAFFTYTVISISFREFQIALEDLQLDLPQIDLIKNAGRGFYVSGLILYGSSLFGAIQMWKLRKAGFHFYTMAQALLLAHPYIFLGMEGFPWLPLIITTAFVMLYARNLKYMH